MERWTSRVDSRRGYLSRGGKVIRHRLRWRALRHGFSTASRRHAVWFWLILPAIRLFERSIEASANSAGRPLSPALLVQNVKRQFAKPEPHVLRQSNSQPPAARAKPACGHGYRRGRHTKRIRPVPASSAKAGANSSVCQGHGPPNAPVPTPPCRYSASNRARNFRPRSLRPESAVPRGGSVPWPIARESLSNSVRARRSDVPT